MIQLLQHRDGLVLKVRAQPRARRARIVGEHGGALKVAVVEPPERGKANESIAALLADYLGLKRDRITLLSGASSRDKQFLLDCRDASVIQMKLKEHSVETAQ